MTPRRPRLGMLALACASCGLASPAPQPLRVERTRVVAPPQPELGGFFPQPMATDGRTVVAGQRGADNRRHLFAIELATGEVAPIAPPDPAPGPSFGRALAIDGALLVVGAPDPGVAADGEQRGEVHVYAREAAGWVSVQRVRPDDRDPAERTGFGAQVAVGPEHVAVGAPDLGLVYLYPRKAEEVALGAPRAITAPEPDAPGSFGDALALDARTLVVGAPTAGQDRAGRVFVHDLVTGSSFTLEGPDLPAGSRFGAAVAVAGDHVAIGAPMSGRIHATGKRPHDGGVGEVHTFRRRSARWEHEGALQPADADALAFFGRALAMEGDRLVVGAPGASVLDRARPGTAYVWTRGRAGWAPGAVLRADTPTGGDDWGGDVGLGAGNLVIGASERGISGRPVRGQVVVFTIE